MSVRIAVLNWRDEAHPEAGGAELIVHELTERWLHWGNDVNLVTSRDHGLDKSTLSRGVPLARVGRVRNFTHHLRAPKKLFSGERPDVILESVNTIPYMLPVRPKSMPPTMCLVHQLALDVWNAHFPGPVARLAAAIEPTFYRPYRKVPMVAYSESTANDLRGLGIRDVSIIPQGGNGPQKIGEKAQSPTLVFAARLAINKRPDHAVEAFKIIKAKHPDARLIMLGDGEMLPALREMNVEGVDLRGKLPRDQVLEIMGEAHLLVACSIREGWGLVVTEANSVGTPAVTYDVHGLRDSVRNGETGILTATNPQALADAVLQLLDDQEQYSRLRNNAIRWGGTHTWDSMALSVLEHLGKTAGVPIVAPRSVIDLRQQLLADTPASSQRIPS
jgi:glycosyltransferase involved in cell wall biosynthesis